MITNSWLGKKAIPGSPLEKAKKILRHFQNYKGDYYFLKTKNDKEISMSLMYKK